MTRLRPETLGRVLAWTAGLALAGFAWRYATARPETPQAHDWSALAHRREGAATGLVLPALQLFVDREMGDPLSARIAYDPETLAGFDAKENAAAVAGWLTLGNKRVGGSWHARLYYRGWETDPSSLELNLTLDPETVREFQGPEFRALTASTPPRGFFRGRLVSAEWLSRYDEKGRLVAQIRAAYPVPRFEQIADFDRGELDEFYGPIARRVARFMRREVFADPKTKIMIVPYTSGRSPKSIRTSDLADGYVEDPAGRLVSLNIGRLVTRQLLAPPRLRVETWETYEDKSSRPRKTVFKPAVVERAGQEYDNGLSLGWIVQGGLSLSMKCPMGEDLDRIHIDRLPLRTQ
jgi:hypothetical protein